MTAAVSVENISFAYPGGDWALAPVGFEVAESRIVAIIGPNGSGKSTALKLMAGLLTPQSGRVIAAGLDVHRVSRREVAQVLGYLPQEVSSEFDFTVDEVVAFGRHCHTGRLGFLGERDVRAVAQALEQTGMTGFRRRPLSRLSGGERRRAFLASVLAQEPRVLLLDEPTSALDVEHQLAFFELLDRLAASGIAVIVVTHELNMASLFASRIHLFRAGRLTASGSPSEVLTEQVLAALYGDALVVTRHPQTDLPALIPRYRASRSSDGGPR